MFVGKRAELKGQPQVTDRSFQQELYLKFWVTAALACLLLGNVALDVPLDVPRSWVISRLTAILTKCSLNLQNKDVSARTSKMDKT